MCRWRLHLDHRPKGAWGHCVLLCAVVVIVVAGSSCGRRADTAMADVDANGDRVAVEDVPAAIGDAAAELPLPVTVDAADAEVPSDAPVLGDGRESTDAPALEDTSGPDAPEPDLPPCNSQPPTDILLPECATAADCPDVAGQQVECFYGSCKYKLAACSTDGKPPLCSDGNSCTADVCVAGDSPTGGVCLYVCVGTCCATGSDCDDLNPCTLDFCVEELCGECVNVPSFDSCCQSNVDCDDGEPCTVDQCNFGTATCQYEATCCTP